MRFGSRRGSDCGFSMLELMVAAAIAGILLVVAYTGWKGYIARQNLKYSVIQVAEGLRNAEERAKAERSTYTVTFAASSSTYVIQRTSGGFLENAQMPSGVTSQSSVVVTFSAFGVPDAVHTVTLQNNTGTKTASVNLGGGITYSQ